MTVELSRDSETGRPIQVLVASVGEDGEFSVPSRRLEPGAYTVEATFGPAGPDAAATFLVWPLGRATGDSTVAVGRLEGVSLVPGRDGSRVTAALFDEEDDRIVVLSSQALTPTRSVSVGAWVKQAESGTWQNVVGKPGTGEVAEQHYALWIDPDGRAVAFFGGGGRHIRVETDAALDSAWHQVAASYDGQVARVYVDGALEGERRGSVELVSTALPLSIGRGGESSDRRAFAGLLADVWVSTEPLHPGRAAELYAEAAGRFRP